MSPWTHHLVVIYSCALHSLYAFDVTDGDIQKCYSNMKYMKEFICLESPTIFCMLKPLGSHIRTLNHNLGYLAREIRGKNNTTLQTGLGDRLVHHPGTDSSFLYPPLISLFKSESKFVAQHSNMLAQLLYIVF